MDTPSLKQLRGSIVAIVTPMKNNSMEVDFEAFERLVYRQLEGNTKGIVVAGTTGESSTLTTSEKKLLVETAKKIITKEDKSVPVIAGIGTSCTETTIAYGKSAQEAGADGFLVVTPFYNKPPQAGLYAHFKKVSDSFPSTPIILYNVPSRTGCDMKVDTVKRLAELPNVIGIKEACGGFEKLSELRKVLPKDFLIYSGNDDEACEAMSKGFADGVISVIANACPEACSTMAGAAITYNTEKATIINSVLEPLLTTLSCDTNPIPIKCLLHLLGQIEDGVRTPLIKMDEKYANSITDAWKKFEDEFKAIH